jgi:energy-coupling factor transport system permease protein
MNDPRLRLLSVAALSIAAFLSVAGTALAALWWLFFSDRSLPSPKTLLYLGITVLLAAIATAFSGGDGFSYLVRCSGVLLVAAYAYRAQRDGDLLDLGAWLGGRVGLPRAGFDLGLVGELSFGSLRAAADDLAEMRLAVKQKRLPLLPRWIAIGTALLFAELRRGRQTARHLALRGYAGGGLHAPVFSPTRADLVAAGAACAVLLLAVLVPRDIFILTP